MPPSQDPPSGATMSPQQIMRARYKQQMMPARTWKQQQARDEQLIATNKARQTQNRSVYTAAAAQAAKTVPQKVQNMARPEISPAQQTKQIQPNQPNQPNQQRAATTTTESQPNSSQPSESASGINREGSSTSLSSQNRKESPSGASKLHATPFATAAASATGTRPPLNRRGSSTTSLSRAAATAAQQSPYRPAESLSSRLSSLSSRRSSASEELSPLSPSSAVTVTGALANESPTNRPSLRRSSTSGSGPLLLRTSKDSLLQRQPQQQSQQQQQQPPKARAGPSRVQSQAGAAARASASSPINIAPRQPLSAKFVSSLSQALRIQQEQREAATDSEISRSAGSSGSNSSVGVALAAASAQSSRNLLQPRKSTESTRSGRSMASSTMSGKSQGGGSAAAGPPFAMAAAAASPAHHDQKYLISADQFQELRTQHVQQMQEKESRERKTNEEIKANALRAALAAGTRVESEMVGIHMQVNDAVRNAQQRRNRRALMSRYRPAASWTAPVKLLKPQLKRLQTTESVKSAGGGNMDEFSPRSQDTPLTATTPSSSLIPLNATPAGWPQAEIPEKWIGEPIPKVKLQGIQSPGGSALAPAQSPSTNRVSYPLSQMTMRSHPRPIKRDRHHDLEGVPPLVGSAHSGSSNAGSLPHHYLKGPLGSPVTSLRSETSDFATNFEKNAGFDFRGRDDTDSNLTQPPPNQHHHHHHHHKHHHHHLPHHKHHHHDYPHQPQSENQAQLLQSPQLSSSSSSSSSQPQPQQARMLRTLRGPESRKWFNEDKPWKGHREIFGLTDRERKRYESLWAANRDIHLPYLYVPPQYEAAWLQALYAIHPELAPSKNEHNGNGNGNGPKNSRPQQHRRVGSSHLVPGYASSVHSAETFNSARSGDTDAASMTEDPPKSSATSDSTSLGVGGSDGSGNGEAASRAASPFASRSNPLTPATSRPQQQHGYDWGEYTSDSGDEMSINDRGVTRFNENEEYDENIDMDTEVEMRSDEVHGYVVARLWRRSRLPEEILAQIWELVDLNKDGTLDRCGFVVGMWLCDQCLYGRKLPRKVPPEVWQSAGKLNLKIRIKQPQSKVGYMRKLPKFLGNVVGHTMHGGRQAVKKAVQTATK